MRSKTPKESLTITTDIVLPNQTNTLNTLFGGELLSRLDRIGYISACLHAGVKSVVTASVNNVSFETPVPMGSIVTIESKVSRAFSSSMEVVVDVYTIDVSDGKRNKVNEAIYTFVALDSEGRSQKVPQIVPETPLEKERYDKALRRRQLSLLLSGRISIDEASELKALFQG